MKTPDPSRFIGQHPKKSDKLEMKGFSDSLAEKNFLKNPEIPPKRTYERSNVRPNVRPDERTYEKTTKRVKIRHAFDIFEDQLFALQARQLKAVQRGKKKPKMGDMVQQAIELFLEHNKP